MSRVVGVALVLILGISVAAFSFGITVGIGAYTIDPTMSLSKVRPAVTEAGNALGLPQPQINDLVNQVTAAIPAVTVILVPVVGGTVEIGVPLVVIDSVRISSAVMTDGMVRGIASAAGEPIPQPLIDETFATGTGTLTIDPSFFTYTLTIAAGKQFDLFIAAVDLNLGATWIAGEVTPGINVQVPEESPDKVKGAIAALHPDGISWSGFGLTTGIGIELGPPFLRVRAQGGLFVPVYITSGWWEVKPSGITAGLGITVRF